MSATKDTLTLGLELGSTRIKAVLINSKGELVAEGMSDWEDDLVNGYWTYTLEEVWHGIQSAYAQLRKEFIEKNKQELTNIDYIGISAMMHGYLVFDANNELLTPFRTWRNVNTDEASKELSKLFEFNIPHRWSISHLYQSILDAEEHVNKIQFMTTLAGYVHWKLTGEKVIGIGDASGMFPIDYDKKDYDENKIESFEKLSKVEKLDLNLKDILPECLLAGEKAGTLTEEGAKLLDPSGNLNAGSKFAPPEGDAGSGMVATNTIEERTGNVSVGTSVFAMIVLENELDGYYPEIDIVSTPDGKPVAMVHCNNGTPDLDSWIKLFKEVINVLVGTNEHIEEDKLYKQLFELALTADKDASDIVNINFLTGEPIADVYSPMTIFSKKPNSQFSLNNFMLAHLYSIYAVLRMGLDILTEKEDVIIDELIAHGGVFKTKDVMQNIMSACLKIPVSVYPNANTGGAWGMSLLANYKNFDELNLSDYLDTIIYSDDIKKKTLLADEDWQVGFDKFLINYKDVLNSIKE